MSLVVSPSSAQWSDVLPAAAAGPPSLAAYLMTNADGTYSITLDVTTAPFFESQADNTIMVVA